MNNYEKYKDEIIKMLIYSTKTCRKIRQIRTCNETTACPLAVSAENYELCRECERLNEQWLNEEAEEFYPSELKAGDKVVMRKQGNMNFFEYEVICNMFPICWLRFRELENDTPKADNDFLIFYDDLLDDYYIKEVIKQ